MESKNEIELSKIVRSIWSNKAKFIFLSLSFYAIFASFLYTNTLTRPSISYITLPLLNENENSDVDISALITIENINLALMFLGVLHGLTNLGGTLLAIIASNISKNKDTILYYIASGYLIFAIFQLFFVNIFFERLNLLNLNYVWLPILIFLLSRIVFNRIENIMFYRLLNIFTLFYGIYILINSLIL